MIELCDAVLLERGVGNEPRPAVARCGTWANDCFNPQMFVIDDAEQHATRFERRTIIGFAEHLRGQMFWKEAPAYW